MKANKIGAVITKDMSRIGRNYLEVGFYTEVVFPQNNVRFIAIDSGVDSIDQSSSEFAPIVNLVNEWYVKDFSERMKAARKAKRIAGEHTCTVCRYGYRKDPDNPEHWLIDQEAAAVVRCIFQLALEGKRPGEISRLLHNWRVKKPSYYRAKRQPNFQLPQRPYDWDIGVVQNILTSREYIGSTVNHKTIRPTYKSRSKTTKLDKSEWQIIDHTQDPIVSERTFFTVQDMLTPRPERKLIEGTNPLKGLVYCADCGKPMSNKRQSPQPAKDKNGIPTGKYTKFYDGFECSTYTLGKKHKETVCSRHGVNSEAINVLVLEALKGLSASSLSDEKALLQRLNQAKQPKDDLAQQRKLLRQKQKRSAELDDLIQGAYEANFRGNLTDDRLSSLVAKHEAEQEGLEQEIAVLDAQVKYSEAGKTDGKRFLKSLRKFTSFDTLTPDMVNELIEKIVVHERVGTRSSYEQEIEIYFIFVGKVGEYK